MYFVYWGVEDDIRLRLLMTDRIMFECKVVSRGCLSILALTCCICEAYEKF
jgi:NifU-like protein involved in Fe-S cluster formation